MKVKIEFENSHAEDPIGLAKRVFSEARISILGCLDEEETGSGVLKDFSGKKIGTWEVSK